MKTNALKARNSSSNSHSSKPFFNNLSEGSFFSGSQEMKQSFFNPSFIQPKLTIGQPNVDIPKQNNSEKDLQTKPMIMRAPDDELIASPKLTSRLNQNGGRGRSLPNTINSFMSNAFGTDFSDVNIHTGSEAIQMNKEVGSRAFTHGNDIYFNSNEYNPSSTEGKKLLAHELTHTIQQNGKVRKKIQRGLGDGHDLLAERFQGRLELEAAFDNERVLEKGDSGPDVVILQLALIDASPGPLSPLPKFGADGDFGSETKSAVEDFQRTHGLTDDGVVGPRTMEALDGLFTVGPVIAPNCPNPGFARTLRLQPVFFRDNAADPDPTGGTFFTQLSKANEIWSKLGVTFTSNSPVFLDDPVHKTHGSNDAEVIHIGTLHTGADIEVFFVDNNVDPGGAATMPNNADSFMVLSDFGTSETLMAHELGHVLGLGHPPSNADPGTIMQPTGSHSIPNPERNTMANHALIVFPAETDPICLTPDP